jgi:site-specific recombinase XerD
LGKTKAETRLDADLSEQELSLWDEMTQRLRDRKHRLNYRKAIKHFKHFLSYKKWSGVTLEDLNNSLALSFKDYLLNSIPELNKKGMTDPTALGNIKKFRTIFDRAVDEDLLVKNPFKKIKLKNQSPIRDRLDIQQIKLLHELEFIEYPSRRLYRDFFLF